MASHDDESARTLMPFARKAPVMPFAPGTPTAAPVDPGDEPDAAAETVVLPGTPPAAEAPRTAGASAMAQPPAAGPAGATRFPAPLPPSASAPSRPAAPAARPGEGPPPPLPSAPPAGKPVIPRSVLEASNAAVAAQAPRPPRPAPAITAAPKPVEGGPKDLVKLLWFDPGAVARIRAHDAWRVLIAERELRLLSEDGDHGPGAAGDPAAPSKERRCVFEVLVHGRAIGPDEIASALSVSVSADGRFEPPLALLAGELELPPDEIETLKATATALAPLAGVDKRLRAELDAVESLLKTPWIEGSGALAEGLCERLREAFAQGRRVLSPDYLESHTERILLERRAYQRRTVYGRRWIRAVLLGGGKVPVYLPEDLKDELPMFRRLRVRAIVEVDVREDQYETAPCAVKIVALGRVVTGG